MRILFLIFGILAACGSDNDESISADDGSFTVRVTVVGAQATKGIVRGAIFDNADEFPDGRKVGTSSAAVGEGGKAKLRFENLKAGAYAISLYHDANENNEFDKSGIGLPEEQYGFSNDAEIGFGPPSFEDAKFNVKSDRSIEITLQGSEE